MVGVVVLVGAALVAVSSQKGDSAQQVANKFGSNPGPESTNDYQCYNGVCHFYRSSTLNQASTTLCSLKSPTNATSTLAIGSFGLTTGTTTGVAIEMAKSSIMDATTTRISYVQLASGARVTFNSGVATSTGNQQGILGIQHTADENDLIFAPGTLLNVKVGGTLGALNVLTGSCMADFVAKP